MSELWGNKLVGHLTLKPLFKLFSHLPMALLHPGCLYLHVCIKACQRSYAGYTNYGLAQQ